ncbi:aromatic prenyltransferase [Penicillium concentricum]|uniref:Aromatic prenyltransferase n=1 Tax=Penicillium concentricum TaxID=293559 RepID=A0A9W9V2W0_9EURO|nr:aromatic prenyltransferase [Penicillium concentricum]KAJ5365694.1 aromatic prenyltransferase [Penicillium concentricum]
MTKSNQEPWQVLGQFLQFPDAEHELWWHRIAPIIGRALIRTGCSVESQFRHLLLIQCTVLPFLGHYPAEKGRNITWRSCIAGDEGGGGPMDVSVNYQQNCKSTVRMNLEPIGSHAGMHDDPMNQVAPREMLSRLAKFQSGIDLTWYDQLENDMILKNQDMLPLYKDVLSQFDNKTQTLFGLDLGEGSVTVKAYFFPLLRASATRADWISIMFESMRNLSGMEEGIICELGIIEEYTRSISHKLLPEHSEVGFDCKSPAQSRIKIYAAMKVSSLQDLYDFHTLGGHLKGPSIEQGFEILSKLWHMVYPKLLPHGKSREFLQVHCNWELSLKNPTPVPKTYFLVADELDTHISSAVISLFRDLGWHQHAENHEALERESYPTYDPKTSTGIYTWLAFAYSESSGPYITVYLKPPAPTPAGDNMLL